MRTRKRARSSPGLRRLSVLLLFAVAACGGDAKSAQTAAGASAPAGASGTPTAISAADAAVGPAATAARGGRSNATPAASPAAPVVCEVGSIPDAVRRTYKLSDYYRKYANAEGIPVVTSEQPADQTLVLACELVNEMVGERRDVRDALIANKAHFTIIGANEKTTDTPEYAHLPDFYDTRARGLGGKVASCAEESILCDRPRDRWRGESICVHEFSHTIAIYGLYTADPTFERRLKDAWRSALSAGLFRDTYAAETAQEYWAEGVQDWYDTNLQASPANGVHNEVNTQRELAAYDPRLFALIDELLPRAVRWRDCYRDRGPN